MNINLGLPDGDGDSDSRNGVGAETVTVGWGQNYGEWGWIQNSLQYHSLIKTSTIALRGEKGET